MKKTPYILMTFTVLAVLVGYTVYNRSINTAPRAGEGSAATGPFVRDPEVASIIDELCAKWDGVERLSAVVHTEMPGAAGMEGRTTGVGYYDYQRTDADPLLRLDLRNNMKIRHAATLRDGRTTDQFFTGEVLVFTHDGTTLWQLLAQPDRQQVYKRRYDPADVLQFGGRALWNSITADATVTRLPDETAEQAGGREAYVFLETPLNGDWSGTHWFDKATGLRLKTIEKNAAGAETLNMWLDEIDFAPQFPQDRFVFEIPEGYELIDETGSPDPERPEVP